MRAAPLSSISRAVTVLPRASLGIGDLEQIDEEPGRLLGGLGLRLGAHRLALRRRRCTSA